MDDSISVSRSLARGNQHFEFLNMRAAPLCVSLRARRTSAFGGPKITENGSPSESTSQRTGRAVDGILTNSAVRKSLREIVKVDAREPGILHLSSRHIDSSNVHASRNKFKPDDGIVVRSRAPTSRSIRFKSGIFQDVAKRLAEAKERAEELAVRVRHAYVGL